jgi:hypothetical protein
MGCPVRVCIPQRLMTGLTCLILYRIKHSDVSLPWRNRLKGFFTQAAWKLALCSASACWETKQAILSPTCRADGDSALLSRLVSCKQLT